jgi:integral membrane protein (TIGR01906 family)
VGGWEEEPRLEKEKAKNCYFIPRKSKILEKMKALGIAARWVFILCLPFLLFTASLAWAINSLWLYNYGFEKYNISQVTGLSESELNKVAGGLVSYFNSDEEYISLTVTRDGQSFELFNYRETIHLSDVKKMIWLDYKVLLGTLLYILAYAGVCLFWRRPKYRRNLGRGLVGGSALTLGLMLALGVVSIFDFNWIFWQFHVISFTSNDFWLLDPTRDYLKMLFPDGYFYDVVMFCALGVAGAAVIIGGLSGLWLRLSRKRQQPG